MTESTELSDYVSLIYSKAEALVAAGIWAPLNERDLREWQSQFFTDKESLVAALILDNLIFRPRKQLVSLLIDVFLSPNLPGNASHDLELLKGFSQRAKKTEHVLVPVIGRSQAPTKSGPYILRLLQRESRIKDQHLMWAETALENAASLTSIILVDDFSGTGRQFEEFLSGTGLSGIRETNPEIIVTLCCAAIHEKAIDRIREKFPWINILSADVLDTSHGLFSEQSCRRLPHSVSIDDLKDAYNSCLRRANIKVDSRFSYGYGNLGLCYSFAHATPNNSVPLLWFDSDSWRPLVSR